MPAPLHLSPADRLLLVAPHPDDETLAAGGLIQAAVAAGAAVRVVFLTDGENNPWAQRATEGRLFIGAAARRAFGARRRREALASLAALGLDEDGAEFFGFPDQGTTAALLADDRSAAERLTGVVRAWRPSLVVGPSLYDLHPDHSALAVVLLGALARLPLQGIPSPRLLTFVVHNPHLRHAASRTVTVRLDPDQVVRKLHAIRCNRSQLFWRGSWLESFAADRESFWEGNAPAADARHPIAGAEWRDDALVLGIASHSRARAWGKRTLLVVGTGDATSALRLAVALPGRTSTTSVVDPRDGRALGVARLTGTPQGGELTLPRELLGGPGPLFAKIARRFGFFDEAGWAEMPTRPALH
ncbi:MAG: PIG-L family deacetylase [Acidobacteria bacterium]|nr:PIG-L family deacetylase [Acidobacteriota bacterium]